MKISKGCAAGLHNTLLKPNRAISDKVPVTYLSPLIAQHRVGVFDAQAIPTEAGLLGVENYKAFLTERRERIATRLNEFLAPELAKQNPATAESGGRRTVTGG